MQVTLDARPNNAPCCIRLVADDGRDILIQTDWDWPGVASNFGWVPCLECNDTDGTVDCAHATATEMIQDAGNWLQEHDGESFDDPGYFGGA